MPDNAARTIKRRRSGIVRAILLLVRGYNAAKNLCLTAPIWPVKHDKDMEPCEDMNDKSKPALSLVPPQARHHFTLFDQVNQLVGANEADPDLGFMGRVLALCSLPRTNPGNRLQYERVNGPYTLVMIAGGNNKLPFGQMPRLLLAWVCTEAVRTQSRDLFLGKSLSDFMRRVGIDPAGASYARVRNQMERLFACSVVLIYTDKKQKSQINAYFADRTQFWWNPDTSGQQGALRLGEEFFNEIINHPVPLDLNILKAMKRSPLGLDLYMWVNYRTFALDRPLRISWVQLYRQFGPAEATDDPTIQSFRRKALRELKKIKVAWPGFDYATPRGALELSPTTTPSVAPRQRRLLSR